MGPLVHSQMLYSVTLNSKNTISIIVLKGLVQFCMLKEQKTVTTTKRQ